jgi:hypothetical protein
MAVFSDLRAGSPTNLTLTLSFSTRNPYHILSMSYLNFSTGTMVLSEDVHAFSPVMNELRIEKIEKGLKVWGLPEKRTEGRVDVILKGLQNRKVKGASGDFELSLQQIDGGQAVDKCTFAGFDVWAPQQPDIIMYSCGPSQYNDTVLELGIHSHQCRPCHAYSSSPKGSDAVTDCECLSGYTGVILSSSSKCIACPADTIKTLLDLLHASNAQ